MAKRDDIRVAFDLAMKISPKGKRTVTTADFVDELEKLNWHWSFKEANQWIEYYVTTFRDISTQEGEDRTFMLFNPYGVF